jgi:HlyD family secretion protein
LAAGTPLLEIGNPANLEIVLDLLSSDAVKVRLGAPMLVESGEGRSLRARVRTIEPSAFTKVSALGVEEQRVNVIGDFAESAGRLGDGYRVEASIILWEGNEVVRAPASSLFRRDSRWTAFVVERGRARRRDVVVGQRNSEFAEVVRGLRPGEIVILHPGDGIEEGTRVRANG